MDNVERYTVKKLMAKLAELPDDALIVVDNDGECRFLVDGDLEVEEDKYIRMDEGECEEGENDRDDGPHFPCVLRVVTWS